MSKKKWSRSEVEYLQTGREIHEALTTSRQPDYIEVRDVNLMITVFKHLSECRFLPGFL